MNNETIKINAQQYEELKLLFNASSKDITSRQSLTCIYYDHMEKRVCSTDGHILRFYYIHLGESDLLMPPESFTLSVSQFKTINGIGRTNSGKQVDFGVIHKADLLPYPEVDKVIPSQDSIKPIAGVSLDFNNLVRLQKSYPKSAAGINICMFFTSSLGGVLLYDKYNSKASGIIMPSKMQEEHHTLLKNSNKRYEKDLLAAQGEK